MERGRRLRNAREFAEVLEEGRLTRRNTARALPPPRLLGGRGREEVIIETKTPLGARGLVTSGGARSCALRTLCETVVSLPRAPLQPS